MEEVVIGLRRRKDKAAHVVQSHRRPIQFKEDEVHLLGHQKEGSVVPWPTEIVEVDAKAAVDDPCGVQSASAHSPSGKRPVNQAAEEVLVVNIHPADVHGADDLMEVEVCRLLQQFAIDRDAFTRHRVVELVLSDLINIR